MGFEEMPGTRIKDEIAIAVVDAFESLSPDLENLLKFTSDFPEEVKEDLRQIAADVKANLPKIASFNAIGFGELTGGVVDLKSDEVRRHLRHEVGKEIVSKMEAYLYDHEIPSGTGEVGEEEAAEFLAGARGLLTEKK